MTLEAVLEMLQRSVDGALGKVPDDVEGEPIDAARSTLEHAANTIEGLLLAMKAPSTAPTEAEVVTLIKAQRDVA